MKQLLFPLGAVVGMGACAAMGMGLAPRDPRASAPQASAAIVHAEQVGAKHVPGAAQYLDLAQSKVDAARALASKGMPDEAASLFIRAEADAELAAALARSDTERADARVVVESVRSAKKGTK